MGTMGAALALNMADKGYRVAVYNRTAARTADFLASAGSLAGRLAPCGSLHELAGALRPPRPVVLMINAGAAVDEQASLLAPSLARGDMLIDAGNANFHDTERRCADWAAKGIAFLGVGVSGGEEGARHGPSIMTGGPEDAWRRVAQIFTDIAARYQGEPCSARVGPGGAGHFVKTVHNGIEYADMQLIAEVYAVMRDGLGWAPDRAADVFAAWNDGPLRSYLIEITAIVLRTKDGPSGGFLIDHILDKAGQKGTGRWAVIEAQALDTPATVIEAAVAARNWAARKEARVAGEALFGAAPRRLAGALGADAKAASVLHQAMLVGRIIGIAQGFAVMAAASAQRSWSLPLATVARIWRAGCIIRSAFLDDIATAFTAGHGGDLTTAPFFAALLKQNEGGLRRLVAAAALAGIPLPAFSAALASFDSSRTAQSAANLLQGQRDFFGAHGFERTDRPGVESHGPWSNGSDP
ncbi:MAG: NADP-dependent phosphogluconate dehydrogenase [Pseudomonadota bacterium]|nr:NADP-dependent phosphogluconate dehydrogenase [Pseudomonadota bacterium]